MSHIRKNNGKTSAPHKVHIIEKETLLTFLEGYSRCLRGLSPVVLNFVAGEAVSIFCLSRPIDLNVKSSPVKQMLCIYIIHCVVQAVRGGIIFASKLFLDLLYCVRLPLAEDVVLIPRSKQVLVKFSCV